MEKRKVVLMNSTTEKTPVVEMRRNKKIVWRFAGIRPKTAILFSAFETDAILIGAISIVVKDILSILNYRKEVIEETVKKILLIQAIS